MTEMKLDALIEAAEADREELDRKRAVVLKEREEVLEGFKKKLQAIDDDAKRIERILRAAGRAANPKPRQKRSGKLQPGDEGYKYRQVGIPLLQRLAEWAAKQPEEFTRNEWAKAVKAAEGQTTYATRDLIALGWLHETAKSGPGKPAFLRWTGPKKVPSLRELTEPRRVAWTNAQGKEHERVSGWRFKDPETRKRAGMEEEE